MSLLLLLYLLVDNFILDIISFLGLFALFFELNHFFLLCFDFVLQVRQNQVLPVQLLLGLQNGGLLLFQLPFDFAVLLVLDKVIKALGLLDGPSGVLHPGNVVFEFALEFFRLNVY